MLKPSTLIALALPFGLAACSDPPPPSEVRARITDDLGHVLRESAAAEKAGGAAMHTDAAFGLIERFGGPSATIYAKRIGALNLIAQNKFRINSPDDFVGDGSVEPSTGVDTDRLIEELNTKIFTDANHLGDGIYKMPASLVCTQETFNDDGTITTAVDAECAEQFDKAVLRIRVATDDDRLTLALQVGADHDEPLRFSLSHTSLAVTLDLDATGKAVTSIASVLGEAPPNAAMSGEITGQIEILGPSNAKFSLAFGRPLDIKVADEGVALDSPGATRFTSAAANVATLAFDGVGGTGSVVVDLGATTTHVPSSTDDFESTPAIDLDLGGVSVVAMLATDQPLRLTHFGLGERTTTLSVDGQRAISIDLNPNDGRAFGAMISHDNTTGLDTISVSPKLDLNISVDHAVLGDEPPVYDVTRILLEGSLRGGADGAQIEVVSGLFSLTTNPTEFGFTATTGQCVTSTAVADATTGDTFDQWSVGACN